MSLDSQQHTTIARFLYPAGSLLLLAPLMDLTARIWPLQLHLIQWRFQAESSLFSVMSIVLLGLALIAVAAYLAEHLRVMKLVALMALLAGAVLIPVLIGFVLDSIQFRAMIDSSLRGQVRNRALVNGATGLVACIASLSLGFATWKASRGEVRAGGKRAVTPLISDIE